MNIDDDTYVLGLWFVSGDKVDWLATVVRPKDGKTWHLEYRFRYYEGKQVGDLFEDKDRKSWSEGRIDDTDEGTMIKNLDLVAAGLSEKFGWDPPDRALVQGIGFDAFMAATIDKPWVHMKRLEKAKGMT